MFIYGELQPLAMRWWLGGTITKRLRRTGIGTLIMNLRRSSDRIGFKMRIPLPIRLCGRKEYKPWTYLDSLKMKPH